MTDTSRCWLQRATCGWGLFLSLLACGTLCEAGVAGELSGSNGAGGDAAVPLGAAEALAAAAAVSGEEGVSLLPGMLQSAFGSSARGMWASDDVARVGGDRPGGPRILAAAPEAPPGGSRSVGPPKSVGRSLLYSAILPGAGQLYAGSWPRAAVFFGLEVVGWGTYLAWNGKGNDIEDEFRARADTTWSPLSYLAWRNSTLSRNSSITHALPCSSFVAGIASSTPVPDALKGCPGAEKQQYYELIGKYNQFVSGWADVTDQNLSPVRPTEVDSAENFLSETRLSYEDRRDDSNRFLKRASAIGGLILVNHIISAVDAARVAKKRRDGEGEARIAARTRLVFFLRGESGSRMPMLMAYRPLR